MDDRSSIVAAAEVLQNSDWSQLVSLEIGVNGSHPTKEPPRSTASPSGPLLVSSMTLSW